MKRILMTSVLSSVVCAGVVCAPGVSFAEGRKYAVVDMQAVILNVEEGKVARTDLEKEIKDKEKELQKQKEELD